VLERIEQAAAVGAATALLLPPSYYRLSQRNLLRFVEQVAPHASLPLILYHIPERTGHGFSVDVVSEVAQRPEVVGVKDSGKDLPYHHRLLQEVAGASFAVFQGAAPLLLASAAAGSTDSMCPVTALVPEWELALRAALARGDLVTAAEIGQRIDEMATLFALGDGPMPSSFKVIAALLGFGPSTPHDRFVQLEPAHIERLAEGLRGLGFRSLDEGAVAAAASGGMAP
jgi:4-hydroxy-tetrahydrodipicolinate synthase